MRTATAVLLLLMLSMAVGCGGGGPRFDGSSDEAAERSIKEISDSLPKEKEAEFGKAIVTVIMASKFTDQDPNKAIDGLTADQIIAKSKTMEAEMKSKEMGK